MGCMRTCTCMTTHTSSPAPCWTWCTIRRRWWCPYTGGMWWAQLAGHGGPGLQHYGGGEVLHCLVGKITGSDLSTGQTLCQPLHTFQIKEGEDAEILAKYWHDSRRFSWRGVRRKIFSWKLEKPSKIEHGKTLEKFHNTAFKHYFWLNFIRKFNLNGHCLSNPNLRRAWPSCSPSLFSYV